jgi:hypothetical protein
MIFVMTQHGAIDFSPVRIADRAAVASFGLALLSLGLLRLRLER